MALDAGATMTQRSFSDVLAEGRITTPDDAVRALTMGAHAVVVGSAITHPTSITRRFVSVVGDSAPTQVDDPLPSS